MQSVYSGYKIGYQFTNFSVVNKSEGKSLVLSLAYTQKGAIYKENPVVYEIESRKRINALQFELFQTRRIVKIAHIIKTRYFYGIYGSYFLDSQNEVSYIYGSPTSTPVKFGYDYFNDDFKPFDAGLKFGLQVEVKNIFVRSAIEFGINQLRPGKNTNKEIHNRVIEVVAGINL